jgi:tetratricopeptide (TPR) repeat protein
MKYWIFTIGLCLGLSLSFTNLMAQSAHSTLRAGDAFYEKGYYADAEDIYRDATASKKHAQARFNLGNSLFNQGRFEEAAKEYQQAANQTTDTVFRAKALYNKGNSLLSTGDLQESLNAYRQSLLLNPNDTDAKSNYMLALQQQQQQQQQQDQNQEQKEQEQEEQNQQQQQRQDQSEQQQNGSEEEEKESQQPNQKQDQKELSKEDAKRLLEIIDKADSDVQKKLRKSGNRKKPEKEW